VSPLFSAVARISIPGWRLAARLPCEADDTMATTRNRSTNVMQIVCARLMLLGFAGTALYVGSAVLTSLATIPVALVLWLIAAVGIGFAIAEVPQDA
jgi:hypothetical protein